MSNQNIPKTMNEFKRVSNTTPNNNPILNHTQNKKNVSNNQGVEVRGNYYPPTPLESVLPKQKIDQKSEELDFPKPSFIEDDTDYEEIVSTKMKMENVSMQNNNQNNMNMNMNVNQQQTTQQRATYIQVPFQQVQKATQNKSTIATRVEEAEQEINALVGNTEIFLENVTKAKLDIINARSKEELLSIMNEVHEIIRDIPNGFIDAETCRKIKVCFSHLEKTKMNLLEVEEGLLRLAVIDDVEELEKAYMQVPAMSSTDTIYEVRTFELNLLKRLPEIKEEMMRTRIFSAYQ